ncbi:phytanoyl-CoA dioxygenase family protein [Streptomyces antibioticus]|uniref:phytanoyl-CoA dioxygenase family protein n=1 Tax=Streptomyces antibioticus TaxID=1890 RepID=UPI0022542FA7|nr:phytanoyl-CoA dioxygenase family protein [Streptomyces antibioticus]MCX4738715.1 phytanoyl-CoA dioxygenase family protein [Streptomyces antibioticus]
MSATADGLLGAAGFRRVTDWAAPGKARARAAEIIAGQRSGGGEVLRNPHRDQEWAQSVVRTPRLLNAVRDLIGPDVAVENTFGVVKWPGRPFEVPWHQDGINDRLELDPLRSLAAWLALTDADAASGCLHVVPGSHRGGYLPYAVEAVTGAARGRALGVHVTDGAPVEPVPVRAGSGLLMDTRLVHSSPSNLGTGARVGLNIRFVAPGGVRMRDGSDPSLTPISGTGW